MADNYVPHVSFAHLDEWVKNAGTWAGDCWLLVTGEIYAVDYGDHSKVAGRLAGVNSAWDFALTSGAVHVGQDTIWARKRPTQAQRKALCCYLASFKHISNTLEFQGWKVRDYDQDTGGWAI